MRLGQVSGSVWATKKMEGLLGRALLLVTPEDGGPPFVAVDGLGAGPGDRVLVTGGSSASLALGGAPADALIVGIIDREDR